LGEEGGEGTVEGEVGGEEKGDACGLEVVEGEEVVGEVVEGGYEIREEGEEGVFKSRGGGGLLFSLGVVCGGMGLLAKVRADSRKVRTKRCGGRERRVPSKQRVELQKVCEKEERRSGREQGE
jgi:hypothetical protein